MFLSGIMALPCVVTWFLVSSFYENRLFIINSNIIALCDPKLEQNQFTYDKMHQEKRDWTDEEKNAVLFNHGYIQGCLGASGEFRKH